MSYTLNPNVTHPASTLSWMLFASEILNRGYVEDSSAKWSAVIDHEKIRLPDEYEALRWQRENGHTVIICQGEGIVGYLRAEGSSVVAHLAGRNRQAIDTFVNKFKEILVPLPEEESGQVHVNFWYSYPNGASEKTDRFIDAPKWADIEYNYAGSTRESLMALMDGFKPSSGGQLLLWSGSPGTGKTYALRALCEAWRHWAQVDYITDPEAFFGGPPAYLMNLITGTEDSQIPKWKLIILEDAGSFISSNARAEVGQGLSRLLNTSDGFIGQGLQLIVLITTNEALDDLNDAIARPGRSAQITSFETLDTVESKEWAAHHGIEIEPGSHTLAQLYAQLYNFKNKGKARKKGLGFAIPTSA